jgi:two-component system, NarL family, sensor histidine kinase DesK
MLERGQTMSNFKINSDAKTWTHWFPLIWLVFLGLPISGILERSKTPLEFAVDLSLIVIFILMFLWAFFWARTARTDLEQPYQIPSLIGMISSYIIMALLWRSIEGNSLAFVVYAGSFAGFQKSIRPAFTSILISFAVATYLVIRGSDWTVWTVLISTVIAAMGNHSGFQQAIIGRRLRRSQNEVVRVAKIAERERIARDLHDLLGHTLSVIVLKSELASKLAEKNPTRAIAEIRDVERISREALQEVRSAVRGYRSSGLEAELANISLALEAAQIKLEQFIMPLELEWATEQTLAFILREAITNVVRHSSAKTCFVNLEQRNQNVVLEIYDDAQLELTEGNGISGMRERVKALAGEFTLVTLSSKRGVSVQLPLVSAGEKNLNTASLEGQL